MGMRLGLSVLLEPSPHVSWVGSGHETTLQHYLNVYVPYMEVHVHTVEAKWLCNVTYPLSNYVPMSEVTSCSQPLNGRFALQDHYRIT